MAFVVQKARNATLSLAWAMLRAGDEKPAKVAKPVQEVKTKPRAPAKPKVTKRAPRADKSALRHPKPVPAKPGKKSPTKKEREWMDAIVRYGCIACRIDGLGIRPARVHHMLRAGRRIGHLFTLPLCDPGHHQGGGAEKVSRHPHKARFEQKYGSEDHLLARLRAELKGAA